MNTSTKVVEEDVEVKKYKVQYPVSAYEFPREARIRKVEFEDEYLQVELTDGRKLGIPLKWIPTLYSAPREELEKYEMNRSRTMIVWDPGQCTINDEVRIADYLGPSNSQVARK